MIKINKQLNLVHKQIHSLETSECDDELYKVIKEANIINEKSKKITLNLQEELEKTREIEQERKMNDDMLNDLLDYNEDQEEIDDMLTGYEEEVAQEMGNKFKNADKNILPSQIQTGGKSQVKNQDFDDFLMEILN